MNNYPANIFKNLERGEITPSAISDFNLIEKIQAKIEEIVAFQFFESTTAGSTGADPLFFRTTESIEFLPGRNGSDWIVGYDPSENFQGLQSIDILIGDGQPPENKGFDSTDYFVLGDWRKPYYATRNTSKVGDFEVPQFAYIIDLQIDLDIVQLHGSAEDYTLFTTEFSTEEGTQPTTLLFFKDGSTPDLIAAFAGIENLSLEGDYFKYQGTTAPAIELQGFEQLGTDGVDLGINVAHDALGNFYVVGNTSGTLGQSNIGSFDGIVGKYDGDGNQLWTKQLGTQEPDFFTNITTDQQGNFYVVGLTRGNFGGINQGREDIFIAKYDSEGEAQWKRQLGEFSLDDAWTIEVDAEGNVYAGGGYGAFDDDDTLFDDLDAMIVKYDSEGNQEWFTLLSSSDGEAEETYGVKLGSDGYVYATGHTWSDVGGPNNGFYDIWAAVLDKNTGEKLAIDQFGSDNYEYLWGMAIDSQNNFYGAGWTSGDIAGSGSLQGDYDGFLYKYKPYSGNGTLEKEWVKTIGGEGSEGIYRLFIDEEDCIYAAGYTDGDFGGKNAGSMDAWVGKFDTDGNQIWLNQFGTAGYDQAGGLSVYQGEVIVTGGAEGSVGDLNAGSLDGWMARLNAEDGTLLNFAGGEDSLALI